MDAIRADKISKDQRSAFYCFHSGGMMAGFSGCPNPQAPAMTPEAIGTAIRLAIRNTSQKIQACLRNTALSAFSSSSSSCDDSMSTFQPGKVDGDPVFL